MIPNYFTDAQLEVLERNPEYLVRGRECPVCLGEKEYIYQGKTYPCPDDGYGHPMLRLAKLYWLHNIELQYQMLVWDEYPHPDVKREIENYIKHFKRLRMTGAGVTILSPALGVGKTWAATHILREVVKMGYTGWFVQFFNMKNYFEMEDRKERDFLKRQLITAEMLVIDDVLKPWSANESQRALFEEKTEEVVRTRTNMNFPTLVTTNMTVVEFERYYPRVFSLLSAKNQEFEVGGVDARKDGTVWYDSTQLAMKGETRPIT